MNETCRLCSGRVSAPLKETTEELNLLFIPNKKPGLYIIITIAIAERERERKKETFLINAHLKDLKRSRNSINESSLPCVMEPLFNSFCFTISSASELELRSKMKMSA